MTRRGVIAALATIAGALQKGSAQMDEKTTVTGDAFFIGESRSHKLTVYLGAVSPNFQGFDPIEVKLGAESVTLSAREIMDALSPVQPNHCPVCGA